MYATNSISGHASNMRKCYHMYPFLISVISSMPNFNLLDCTRQLGEVFAWDVHSFEASTGAVSDTCHSLINASFPKAELVSPTGSSNLLHVQRVKISLKLTNLPISYNSYSTMHLHLLIAPATALLLTHTLALGLNCRGSIREADLCHTCPPLLGQTQGQRGRTEGLSQPSHRPRSSRIGGSDLCDGPEEPDLFPPPDDRPDLGGSGKESVRDRPVQCIRHRLLGRQGAGSDMLGRREPAEKDATQVGKCPLSTALTPTCGRAAAASGGGDNSEGLSDRFSYGLPPISLGELIRGVRCRTALTARWSVFRLLKRGTSCPTDLGS